MRILFLNRDYPPTDSGVGNYMFYMAQALICAGHEVVVVTRRSAGLPEEEATAGGVVYRAYDSDEGGTRLAAERVLSIARNHGIQVIEGADYLGESAPLMTARERPPILIKLHGSSALRLSREGQILYAWQRLTVAVACWRARRQLEAERRCIERADFITSPTSHVMEESLKQGLRLAEARAVIPNPTPPIPASVPLESATPHLAFVGRIDIRKGIQFLPSIIRRVAASCPGICVEIAGGDTYARGLGSLQAWLKKKLKDVGGEIVFHGRVDPSRMDEIYNRAWVVMLPSRWDNFPTVVLEAMARSRAVVASPFGGTPEMLRGTSCPLEDPADSAFADRIARLLLNPAQRRQAAESGREKAAREYAPAVIARQYVEFLNRHV